MVLLAGTVGAYIMLQPQYKTIDLNGYRFEVPDSSVNVTKVNENYKTYDDRDHNITVKSYAINDVNETNLTGAADMGVQLGSNMGQNATIENKTVYNQSGRYTYYNVSTYQQIVITCDNYETMSHILKTMNKTDVTPNTENLTIDLTNLNSTNNTTTTDTSSKSTTKKSTTKKSGSSDTIYMDDPEGSGEFIGVGEGTYRNKKTGKVYVEYGAGNLKRRPDLDNSPHLLG